MKTRLEAIKLVNEWIKSDSLKAHCLGVAASMEVYAKKYLSSEKLFAVEEAAKNNVTENDSVSVSPTHPTSGSRELIDRWWICGLLHDFDWERHPTMEQHPSEGVKHLRSIGVDEEICAAIMGHGNHTGVIRESLMAKTLFAVDELSGLIVALARVRPGNPESKLSGPETSEKKISGFDGMKAKSVRKAMKKKGFAAAINRDDIRQGMNELGFDGDAEKENEHLELVVKALEGVRVELGF